MNKYNYNNMATKTECQRETGGSRSQSTRIFLKEVEIIQYELEMDGVETKKKWREGWKRASEGLKSHILGQKMSENWEILTQELEEKASKQEEEKELEKFQGELTKMKESAMREIWANGRRYNGGREYGQGSRRSPITCYECGKQGHIARNCKGKEENKDSLSYFSFNKKKKDLRSKASKCIQKVKRSVREEVKIEGVKIEDLMKAYPRAFARKEDTEKMEYCPIEKCKIITEKGKKIVKKGQIVPQALREKTRRYLESLEMR